MSYSINLNGHSARINDIDSDSFEISMDTLCSPLSFSRVDSSGQFHCTLSVAGQDFDEVMAIIETANYFDGSGSTDQRGDIDIYIQLEEVLPPQLADRPFLILDGHNLEKQDTLLSILETRSEGDIGILDDSYRDLGKDLFIQMHTLIEGMENPPFLIHEVFPLSQDFSWHKLTAIYMIIESMNPDNFG